MKEKRKKKKKEIKITQKDDLIGMRRIYLKNIYQKEERKIKERKD